MGPRQTRSKVVCECLGVTEGEVVAAIRAEGLTTVRQVTACTDAGGGCTGCHPAIRALIERETRGRSAPIPTTAYASSCALAFSAK